MLIVCEIIPNALLILICVPTVVHVIKMLKEQIAQLTSVGLVADDFKNLINRLAMYLVILVVGASYMLIIEIYYVASKSEFKKSKKAWIDCVSDLISSSGTTEYTIDFGDDCHDTLISDGYLFPSFYVFTGLPIFIAFVYV